MATITRVRRVANPQRKRRRLTAKQIKYFGTSRQRAALKRKRTSARKRASGVRNPALVVTLGALNPQRRTSTMAATKRRRRKNTSGARRRRRIVKAVAAPRRRRNPSYRRRRRIGVRRRRNPAMFGSRPFSGAGAQMVLGGLLGVAGTKFLARMIPAGLTSFAGTFSPVINNAAGALVIGWVAGRAAKGPFGDAVLFGGMMQVGSTLINALVPNLRLADIPLALSGRGMGEFVPGSFAVPQNPIRGYVAAPNPKANVNMSGITRAFGTAF
jgi:hypothetical protein